MEAALCRMHIEMTSHVRLNRLQVQLALEKTATLRISHNTFERMLNMMESCRAHTS